MRNHPMNRLTVLAAAVAALAAGAASAQRVETAPNNSWITVSGNVKSTSAESFQLGYGGGSIIVEMEDWGDYSNSRQKLVGEPVTVTGRVDDDLFELRTIEASSVYAPTLNTYFYASAADEEEYYYPYGATYYVYSPDVGDSMSLTGIVDSIDGRDLVLDTGFRDIPVSTDGMVYNPLDDQGYQQIDVGDRISVTGDVDFDLFEGREIEANTIVTLDSNVY